MVAGGVVGRVVGGVGVLVLWVEQAASAAAVAPRPVVRRNDLLLITMRRPFPNAPPLARWRTREGWPGLARQVIRTR